MPKRATDATVAAVRRFNRFYTRQIGALDEGLLDSDYSLTEVRILYELAHRDRPTATALGHDLALDAGYLSRTLRAFGARGLVTRAPSNADGREQLLALTAKGRAAYATLGARQDDEVRALLVPLSARDQRRVVDAMRVIEALLDRAPASADGARAPFVLRAHRPGDMGWIIHRHGLLYAGEYGWDERFEALVAEIAATFIQRFDSARERCWIAERDGEIIGCVFLVAKSARVAQLRLLLVEPSARGLGLGSRLVDECIDFARAAGYRRIILWTNDILHSARRIYERAGFRLTTEERHHSFGHQLVGQTWALDLSRTERAPAKARPTKRKKSDARNAT